MKFFSGFGRGVASFFKAFGFVFNNGLWHFMLYPIILWLIMFVTGIFLTHELGNYIQSIIDGWIHSIPEEGHWLSWLKAFENGWLGILVGWIIKLLILRLSVTFMKYLTLIFLSPIFSILSELAAVKLGTKAPSFSMQQLFKDILRGILLNLRNMLLEYMFIFVCFLLSALFPPFAIILAPFLYLAGWYFVGFSMLDYSCEREQMGVIKSVRFVRSNMGVACGLGFCYSLMFLLPTFLGDIIGMMLGPVMAVVGATLAFHEIKKKEQHVSKTI
jgi:CysZ protein